jgi:hypothetical protein
VLYAVRGPRDYWTESEPGLCLMHARVGFGYNEWVPTARKSHRYLIERMAPTELARAIEDLMTRRPDEAAGAVLRSGASLGADWQVPHPREDRTRGER